MLAATAFAIYFLVGVAAVRWLTAGVDDAAHLQKVERGGLGMLVGIVALLLFAAYRAPAVRLWRAGVFARATLLYAAFIAIWLPIVMILYPWLLQTWGVQLEPQRQLRYFAEGGGDSLVLWGAMLATACVLAPAAEEVLFRGYLQQALGRALPGWLAVVVAAGLFGMLHGPEYAFPIGLLGLFFGWLSVHLGCLSAAIFTHALHNSITISVTVLFPQVIHWVYGE